MIIESKRNTDPVILRNHVSGCFRTITIIWTCQCQQQRDFSHLQSNQAPSDDETRELKALRANLLEELSILDLENEQIEGILNSLKRKRAHIQESIDDFNTILAPVRRLSTDVLGLIFSHCLATHRNPVMSVSEAPTLLTQVCRLEINCAFNPSIMVQVVYSYLAQC